MARDWFERPASNKSARKDRRTPKASPLCRFSLALIPASHTLSHTTPPALGLGFADERSHFFMILLPRRGFHATRYVHRIRPHKPHCFPHVFRGQTAGQKNWTTEVPGLYCQFPVKPLPRAPQLIRRKGVEQPRVRVILRKIQQ